MTNFYRIITVMGALFFIMPLLTAETEGEQLFKNNNPAGAVPLLEQDINSGTTSPDAYNYLGLAYYQTGQFDKSMETFEKGLQVSGTNKKILAYNAGNSAFAAGNYTKADGYYSLALAASPDFTPALLNRANARLKADDLQNALTDYTAYLEKKPGDAQKEQIGQMIGLIQAELDRREEEAKAAAAQEAQRKEEEAKVQAEQQRIAEEKAAKEAEEKAAEEARRKKLLEDVANSLQDTSTENMTSGTEDTIQYDSEPELD
jgi:tetratricopeptide (TPR) repeat protein